MSITTTFDFKAFIPNPPPPKALTMKCGYLTPAYDFDSILRFAEIALKNRRFDTFVGRGLSGSIVVPRLADAFGINWMLVRKEGEGSHSGLPAEGVLGKRWIFVDDFIESGATYAKVVETITQIAKDRNWRTVHAGIVQYSVDTYSTAAEMKKLLKVHGVTL